MTRNGHVVGEVTFVDQGVICFATTPRPVSVKNWYSDKEFQTMGYNIVKASPD